MFCRDSGNAMAESQWCVWGGGGRINGSFNTHVPSPEPGSTTPHHSHTPPPGNAVVQLLGNERAQSDAATRGDLLKYYTEGSVTGSKSSSRSPILLHCALIISRLGVSAVRKWFDQRIRTPPPLFFSHLFFAQLYNRCQTRCRLTFQTAF